MKSYFLAALVLVGLPAYAQDVAHCGQVLDSGIKEYRISSSSRAYLEMRHSQYCEGSTVRKQFDSDASASVPVKQLPVKFTGRGAGSAERLKHFCSTASEQIIELSERNDYEELIVTRGLETYEKCLELASRDVKIREKPTLEILSIYLEATAKASIEVRGATLSSAIKECTVTRTDGKDKVAQNLKLTETTQFSVVDSATIVCKREGTKGAAGDATSYLDATVVLDIKGVPYHYIWSGGNILASNDAASIRGHIVELTQNIRRLERRVPKLECLPPKEGKPGGPANNGGGQRTTEHEKLLEQGYQLVSAGCRTSGPQGGLIELSDRTCHLDSPAAKMITHIATYCRAVMADPKK